MPWSGGPFSWLDILGAGRAVEICDRLAVEHGPRFEAPHLLRRLVIDGGSFYGRHGPAEEAA
jgi:3-hydroxyacyl-CoA dehydrogenase/enoyl-CoA hydratase/3-hydroxybutyryl-CoA epimerase